MAGSVDDVNIGSCLVYYNGVDLGYTQGGVKLLIEHDFIDKYNDQELVSSLTMQTRLNVEIDVPLAEENYARIHDILNTTTTYNIDINEENGTYVHGLVFRSGMENPWNFYATRPLVLIPIPISSSHNDRVTIHNAVPIANFNTTYNKDSVRVYNVKFKANSSQGKVLSFGNEDLSYI